ncbi:hypothetical protein [Rhodanobacter sp. DHB23]|uniref:hypothetical protein n=1 Tax=Rhodanobacter sp. DHB23 TaxID=2775923 RepID=UPI001CE15BAB|nr:hypothetical protein [Rhodanobacter sp. DHB23]
MSQQFRASGRLHGNSGTGHATGRLMPARTSAASHEGCPRHRGLDAPRPGTRRDRTDQAAMRKGAAPREIA